MTTESEAASILNRLLRGELAAVETYRMAIDQLASTSHCTDLKVIEQEHRKVTDDLREFVRLHGGEPVGSSGLWGAFAFAVEGAAALVGPSAVMKALKEGEEYGIREYEKALSHEELGLEARDFIQLHIVPRTQAHIELLSEHLH